MPSAIGPLTSPPPKRVLGGKPDWNIVTTVLENSFRDAFQVLRRWGSVHRTGYYNVLVMTVPDPRRLLVEFAAAVAESPGLLNFISHLFPAQRAIDFAKAEEFEALAREVTLGWLSNLAGKRFHVRMHRRGFKGSLSTPKEERFLDEALLAGLIAAGTPGRISFEAPDAVIQIETIDGRAGLSLWTAEDLRRYSFLGVA